VPVMRNEIFSRQTVELVEDTIEKLKNYKTQAVPREINLFYMKDGLRERIVYNSNNEVYEVLNTHLYFDEEAIKQELKSHPECFSPNVILRPLYQEMVLPNLAYIGGGGEIAYWLELKKAFENYKINFPILIVRNSLMWIDANTARKIDNIGLDIEELFEQEDQLLKNYVKENTEADLNLDHEKDEVAALFEKIRSRAIAIDPTLEQMVNGEMQKTINAVERIEAKIFKAEKKNYDISLNQIKSVKAKLFPEGILQERKDNFIPFYLKYGESFFEILLNELQPVERQFVIIKED